MTLPTRRLAGLGAAVLCAASLTALPALAQPREGYGYEDEYAYDACHRERSERGIGGALVGGGLGALAGSNIASSGTRTEGALLGGLLGAVIGGNVGADSAACAEGDYRRPRARYDEGGDGYAYRDDSGYRRRDRYSDAENDYYPVEVDAYSDDVDGYGYDDEDDAGFSQQVRSGDAADGCALAESPIYLPDGSVEKRFVRVCKDANGRYHVVD